MTDRYVFVVHIGPVQPWIAAARTLRDLAFGSWFLSELAKAAARALYDQGAALIFPAPGNPDQDLKPRSSLNASNRVLAVVTGEPEKWAEKAREAVMTRLGEEIQQAFEKADTNWSLSFPDGIHERVRKQVEDFWEIYWAAAPFPDQEYSRAREQALWALDLRKNTRDFGPWQGIPGLPKSFLDGFREAVVVVRGSAQRNSFKFQRYEAHPDVLVLDEKPPLLREGEILSGVDLFKRLGGYGFQPPQSVYHGVPSTSDVAAQPLLKRIGKEKAQQWLAYVVRELEKQGVPEKQAKSETPGVYFFVDRAADLITGEDSYARRRDFRSAFEKEWPGILGRETPNPHPYYALLLADGDGMGALMDAQSSENDHRALSQKLAAFAQVSARIVVEHEGYPIYTGGDDVLALLPLHTVLDALEELDQAFQNAMKGYDHPNTGSPPTLSGGLVLAHHLTPLDDVLAVAREAEAFAKERKGKHGLSMVMLRRGGEAARVRDAWPDLVRNVRFWTDLIQGDVLPRGLPYDLRQLADFLEPAALPVPAYRSEVARVLKQKRGRKDEEAWKDIEEHIHSRFQGLSDSRDASRLLRQIAHEMIIAMDIAKVREMAQMHPAKVSQEATS